MPVVKVKFSRSIQDSQDFGSDDEHMVSRVFFVFVVNGKTSREYSADLKQTVGDDYLEGSFEVSMPGYDGPFNYDGFRRCVEQYYRLLIGPSGTQIRLTGPGTFRMRDNQLGLNFECEFEAEASTVDGW